MYEYNWLRIVHVIPVMARVECIWGRTVVASPMEFLSCTTVVFAQVINILMLITEEIVIPEAALITGGGSPDREQSELSKRSIADEPEPEDSRQATQLSQDSTDHNKEPTDLSKQHTDLSKEHTDLSKEHTDLSKEPTELNKESTDLSKEPVDLSKEPVDLAKELTNFSKESTDVGKEPTVTSKESTVTSLGPKGISQSLCND